MTKTTFSRDNPPVVAPNMLAPTLTRAQFDARLRHYAEDPETHTVDTIPKLVDPCGICRLNVTAQDRSDKTCPHLTDNSQSYHCQDLEIEQDTNHQKIAQLLLRRFSFRTLEDTNQLLIWEDGTYQPRGDIVVKQQLEHLYGPYCTTNTCNEIIGHVQRSTYVKRDLFDADPNLITVENGVLNIETGLLNNYDPHYLSRVKLPVVYDPDATCPTIHEFFCQVVDPADVPTLYEMGGYLLERSCYLEKSFMLIGEGANGKSTYMKLLKALVGPDNVSHEDLHSLATQRFSPAQLDGKLLNISDDLSNITLTRTGIFKSLVSGERVSAQHKYQQPFGLYNTAKLVFATNTLPLNQDDSPAWYRRWHFIVFPHSFEGAARDVHLIDRLTTPSELSGFLNKALAAQRKLRDSHVFTNEEGQDALREHWTRLSDPVVAYVEDRCTLTHDGWISNADIYRGYVAYCAEKHVVPYSHRKFTQELKRRYGQQIQPKRGSKPIDGKRPPGWQGIRPKTDDERADNHIPYDEHAATQLDFDVLLPGGTQP